MKVFPAVEAEAALDTKLRVLVVDDNEGFRDSLTMLLDGEDLQVVGQAGDGAHALELALATQPDVVLMDVRMPSMDGIEATRRLKARFPSIGIVALTGTEDQQAVRDMLVAGASGYVLKDTDGDEIVKAVRRAAAGGALLSPEVTPQVIEELTEALERERRRARQLERAQEALIERAARRHQLISRLGHELRTPVTVILGMAQTLSKGTAAEEEREEILDTIVTRARALARLVERLEAAAEIGLTERTDVLEVAGDVAGSDPRVEVRSDGQVSANLNRAAARRILEELVENALTFSPAGSPVIVLVTQVRGMPEVRVTDLGSGVDPSVAARMFDPLEQGEELNTRTHPGVGLGLTLARMSARSMDGDVVLESTGPGGSTFLWTIAPGAQADRAQAVT
jgi:DNA-binding NarL/FixJ family response regulator